MSAGDAALLDGWVVRLEGSRLVVIDPSGETRHCYPVNHIAAATISPTTPDVFIRFFTHEEIALPAATERDAERIVTMASTSERIQRRAANRREEHRHDARLHIAFGGTICLAALLIVLWSLDARSSSGWVAFPIGGFIVGGSDLLYGILKYYTD